MNERSMRVLEWPKIKERLQRETSFSLGAEHVQNLQPQFDLAAVEAQQELTSDALALLWREGSPPFGGAKDIGALLKRTAVGGMLDGSQLLECAGVIYCSQNMVEYLTEGPPSLQRFTVQLAVLPELYGEITRCIDEDGGVRDQASPQLAQIRVKMRSLAQKVRDKLDSLIHNASVQKQLQESIVTIRNNRYVVPVKAEYKNHFAGIVHDQSASGATLFMEPAAVVELNNQLRLAEQEEQREIIRILQRLSGWIQNENDALLTSLDVLGKLDAIFARAKLSRAMKGVRPKLNDSGNIHIKQGRHPLLGDDVVPIDIWLGDDFRILVITGPNTGGKTVTLKTVGLFTIMMQAGLHVPAADGTAMALFQGVYADIGDEQSIEQSLSTFSSHMTNIVDILDRADQQSLVLLDELGAGTDPTEGAALAQAILEFLKERAASCIATTHYSQLKSFAYSNDDVENASVEFDIQTLRPTYRLAIGVPGRSNAFAIASRLGLQNDVIDIAKSLLTEDQVLVDDLIIEIESSRASAVKDRDEAAVLRRRYDQLKQRYDEKMKDIEQERQQILRQAQDEAAALLHETRSEMDQLIGQLRRQHRGELEQVALETRAEMSRLQERFRRGEEQKAASGGPKELKPGEPVRIISLRQNAHVLEGPNSSGEVLVQAGIMKVTVKASDLERIEGQQNSKAPAQRRHSSGVGKAKSESIRSELDLRGMTVDEALPLVDKYVDDAFLASLNRINLIHGKGTGALRDAIAQQLQAHPLVKSFRLGNPNEGGSGVTSVELAKNQ